jgi:hypothetical protein
MTHPTIDPQVSYALANPVTSPDAEVGPGYHFVPEPYVSACLTADCFREAERPMWHLSLTLWDRHANRPLLLGEWSPTMLRNAIAIRDKLMRGIGVVDPWAQGEPGKIAMHWRKPLRVDEVAKLPLDMPEPAPPPTLN